MRTSVLGIALVGAASAVAGAQTADPAEVAFEKNLERYKEHIDKHFAPQAEGVSAEEKDRRQQVAVATSNTETKLDRVRATPELAPLQAENATTAAHKLTAAISTDVEDVEAGVTLSPAKLAGYEFSAWAGATVTVASLEGGGARAGLGYAHAWAPSLRTDELGLPHCDASTLIAEAEKLHDAYVELCHGITLGDYPTSDAKIMRRAQNLWIGVALACGQKERIPADASDRIEELSTGDPLYVRSRDLVEFSAGNPLLQEPRAELAAWLEKRGSRTSCFSDDEVTNAVANALWSKPRIKVGIAAHGDFFARVYGFKPDPDEELSRGELGALKGNLEMETSWRRYTFTFGLGAGYAREKPADELGRTIAANFGLRVLIARLDKKPLRTAILDDDSPVFALGLTARGEKTLDKPESQETSWNEIEIRAFADFKVSKELAFRLGVPLKAAIATREANDDVMPPIAEKRGLQWTLPVFVATVLKL